ncbi:MAG: DegT/DnrJ/EryC1/StrS family aminotransferase [Pseudonocardiaceae bacterium]
MATEPVNPNVFGAATVTDRARDNALRVLADREMFRYRADGARSWNDRLETSLGTWSNCVGAVATNSGTSSLRVALRAAGVAPGDHVLVSAYTFVATPMAVVAIGAVPVPVDVSSVLGVDLDDLAKHLHPGVRAVIAVHVQGHLADLCPVRELLARRDIALIEDACQAFGASTGGRPAGSVGDLGVFSFQQAKQLAAGEGGAIVSKDPDLVAACALQVDLGAVRDDTGLPNWDDERAVLGEGCRMTELQAAVLCAQLDELPAVLDRQRAVRSRLRAALEARGVPTVRSADPEGDSASHLVLLADGPDQAGAIIARARDGGVLVRLIWDRPYYRHRVFERAGLTPEKLGVVPATRAEDLAPRLLSVPIPGAGAHSTDHMVDVISAAVSGHGRGG